MWNRAIAYAPLAPIAVAVTGGAAIDRLVAASSIGWLLLAGLAALAWAIALRARPTGAMVCLWACTGCLAGAYHHAWRNDFAANDIAQYASIEPRIVRLRGTLLEEPVQRRARPDDPFVARARVDTITTVIDVEEIESNGQWTSASGRVRTTIEGDSRGLHVGDAVEVFGRLAQPLPPQSPGERDRASVMLDERIRCELRVVGTGDLIVRLERGTWGIDRALAEVRGWGRQAIDSTLAERERPIASALLLGDTSAMSSDDWGPYVRTGVVHVLAISGQHLVILAAVLWFVLRAFRAPRRGAAIVVALVLLGYALMTGGRPSALRAAVMACAVCGAILLRTRALPGNTFSLAWLVVFATRPTDLFNAGFQLSFVCVAILIWGIPRWFPVRERTPLEQLIDDSRSGTERAIRSVVWLIGRAYLVTAVLSVATAPLVMYWQNLASPGGLLIGPVAIALTTISLVTGVLLVLAWPLGPVAWPFAWAAGQSLSWCDALVQFADRLPGACWWTGPVPLWWLIGFYGIVGLCMLFPPTRLRPRGALTLAGWCVLGLAFTAARPTPDELRVAFLAVDHGGCAVIECPDRRVILYDVGSASGPEVTARTIAPYLWSRSIRRIDEVFLSHADLDHFNGLSALVDRFAIGRVTYSPSFADKPTVAVQQTLARLQQRGIEVRQAHAGQSFSAGEVELQVLHPPPSGPEGVENVRSMVLLVKHLGRSLLLTGDLEGVGQDRLVSSPPVNVDVLMTPHHGSGKVAPLVEWARPQLAIAFQGRGDVGKAEAVYRERDVPYLATWPHGTITLHVHRSGVTYETFATGRRGVVR